MANKKFKKKCLIGSTGTIGKNLQEQSFFSGLYNSKNIHKINKKNFDITICVGAPGSMAQANKYPKQDYLKIKKLMKFLKILKTENFVLISTIQVFSDIKKKNHEKTKKLYNKLPYGKNRRRLEIFCLKNFKQCLVVRLPSIFGNHIKKNFIFDILNPLPTFIDKKKYSKILTLIPIKLKEKFIKVYNKNGDFYFINRKKLNTIDSKNELNKFVQKINLSSSSLTNPFSKYQYYNLKYLWKDINTALSNDLKIINLATEPLKAHTIYKRLSKKKMKKNDSKIYIANMITKYGKFWNSKNNYIYNKNEIIKDLLIFYNKKKNEISHI
mgnify:CR=1 FL=1|tara:strand:+ start:968 stop:1945 length:978 start_codon:yes stop_codon:yes gene_type:complete